MIYIKVGIFFFLLDFTLDERFATVVPHDIQQRWVTCFRILKSAVDSREKVYLERNITRILKEDLTARFKVQLETW